MASEFELKLNSINKEKDEEIEKLHAKIAQLQQKFSDSLISFEKHETAISAKETEKEVCCNFILKLVNFNCLNNMHGLFLILLLFFNLF